MRRMRTRRRLSMTSLIDVIFLLLLFFMLSSTFSNFSEVEIAAAAAGGTTDADAAKPYFLRLGPDRLSLNGEDRTLDTLAEALGQEEENEPPRPVLVSLRDGVSAQRLTDLLVALRGVKGITVTVLGTT